MCFSSSCSWTHECARCHPCLNSASTLPPLLLVLGHSRMLSSHSCILSFLPLLSGHPTYRRGQMQAAVGGVRPQRYPRQSQLSWYYTLPLLRLQASASSSAKSAILRASGTPPPPPPPQKHTQTPDRPCPIVTLNPILRHAQFQPFTLYSGMPNSNPSPYTQACPIPTLHPILRHAQFQPFTLYPGMPNSNPSPYTQAPDTCVSRCAQV